MGIPTFIHYLTTSQMGWYTLYNPYILLWGLFWSSQLAHPLPENRKKWWLGKNTYRWEIAKRLYSNSEWDHAVFAHLAGVWNSVSGRSHEWLICIEQSVINHWLLNLSLLLTLILLLLWESLCLSLRHMHLLLLMLRKCLHWSGILLLHLYTL